ncbi:MAG: undecaprenyl/decaprenyl-phosphate alpha-N-acetylglucosaminyl 1-phosphate transferase, partial [Pedobacter sp.]|nr:undecaprenyl/decaprenyl-phosphate alpha-N-acetylglucosaminyl 1-phosphate transferase [Chitinophagaceae bacterium]
SLVSFLIYNYSPARIFMGDTGSMLAGIINAILAIRFIGTATDAKVFHILAAPAMAFGILLMPLMDTLRVFAIRILHGRSPFSPDRNHLHHLLLDRGLNHMQVTATISITSLFFIVLTYFALPLGATGVIALQTTLFFSGIFTLGKIKTTEQKIAILKNSDIDRNEITTNNKVYSFVSFVTRTKKTIREEEEN